MYYNLIKLYKVKNLYSFMSDILKKITEIQQHRKMINKYLLQINILEEEIKTGEKLVYKNINLD